MSFITFFFSFLLTFLFLYTIISFTRFCFEIKDFNDNETAIEVISVFRQIRTKIIYNSASLLLLRN